jgi:ATP-dependent DNA helicase RecG
MDDITTAAQLNELITHHEGENLEFKKAQFQFDEKEMIEYCSALANEGGGKLIFGVEDKTHSIVSTQAFINTHHELPNKIFNALHISIRVKELYIAEKRVLIFHIPSKKPGEIVRYKGVAYMRAGSSLKSADDLTLKRWLTDDITDFSATIIDGTTMADIDETALQIFKNKWAENKKNGSYKTLSTEKTLTANNLIDSRERLTCAALVLFGTPETLQRLMPNTAEILCEWRIAPTIKHDARKTWRQPFFSIFDEIWQEINSHNIRFPYQEGFIQKEILAFTEKPIREAVLNAVAHRDYTLKQAPIFIKTSPAAFVIQSPGGFLPGITPETIVEKHLPRNRLICDILERAGLVERSGQGMDEIFRTTISEGKGAPSFTGSDAYEVRVTIPAIVTDSDFVKFLEKIAQEKQITFSPEEIIQLEQIRNQEKIQNNNFLKKFLELGIIEKIGQTRGTKYILCHKYYAHKGKTGEYTRIKSFSREKMKELILNHIRREKIGYSKDIKSIFPELREYDINNLLRDLKKQGMIIHEGTRQNGYWKIKIE